MKKKSHLQGFLSLALLVIGAECIVLLYSWLHQSQKTIVERAISECSTAVDKSSCYDRVIPKLTNNLTMEESFSVTKQLQDSDRSYQYCHVLGHALGARETKKDISKWKDVVARCPSDMCSNGCIHGAFQQRFRSDILTEDQIPTIKKELTNVCGRRGSWNPTGLEKASCVHALGHLFMYITQANIVRSVGLCDELVQNEKNNELRTMCYDGVFMQIFQPLEAEDKSLIKGKEVSRQNHESFCNHFSGQVRGSCISEGWPLYLSDLIHPEGLVTLCSKEIGTNAINRCFDGVMYALVVQAKYDLPTLKAYCLGLPQDLRGRCFANVASRLIETDWRYIEAAASWCRDIEDSENKQVCFKELQFYASFTFPAHSKETEKLCSLLPDDMRRSCPNTNKR